MGGGRQRGRGGQECSLLIGLNQSLNLQKTPTPTPPPPPPPPGSPRKPLKKPPPAPEKPPPGGGGGAIPAENPSSKIPRQTPTRPSRETKHENPFLLDERLDKQR